MENLVNKKILLVAKWQLPNSQKLAIACYAVIISYRIISYHIRSYHIIYFPSVDPYGIT